MSDPAKNRVSPGLYVAPLQLATGNPPQSDWPDAYGIFPDRAITLIIGLTECECG